MKEFVATVSQTASAMGAEESELWTLLNQCDIRPSEEGLTREQLRQLQQVLEERQEESRLRAQSKLEQTVQRYTLLIDTCADDRLAAIARRILMEDGRFEEVLEAKVGCTVFCHAGPGALGIVFLRKV